MDISLPIRFSTLSTTALLAEYGYIDITFMNI